MKVRYIIEYALKQDTDGHSYYQPVGIWARGLGPWEMTVQYLPDVPERQEQADGLINDIIEQGDEHLPDNLLEQWCEHLPLYMGDCSPIYMTDARNSEAVATAILEMLQGKETLGDPPLPPT